MNTLEQAIQKALQSSGEDRLANKAYLEFLKANFIVPVEKNSKSEEPEVLFHVEGSQVFLPVFTNKELLDKWAVEIQDQINILKLSAVDLLKGIGENVTIALNPGSDLYKEFNTAEVMRLKNMVLKIFK